MGIKELTKIVDACIGAGDFDVCEGDCLKLNKDIPEGDCFEHGCVYYKKGMCLVQEFLRASEFVLD